MFIDKVLPYGLRSAPLIFTAVADALQWIMSKKGVCPVYHYLDDVITLGPLQSAKCQRNLESIMDTCKFTGTPLDKDKCKRSHISNHRHSWAWRWIPSRWRSGFPGTNWNDCKDYWQTGKAGRQGERESCSL